MAGTTRGLTASAEVRVDAFARLMDLERELSRQSRAGDMNTTTMSALKTCIGAESAAVISVDTTGEDWRWRDSYCDGQKLHLDYLQAYLDSYGYEDPIGALSFKGKTRAGDVTSCRLDPDEARPFYERFYVPQDIRHILGVVVSLDRCLVSIGLHRRADQADFDDSAIGLALLGGRLLASHYQRALDSVPPLQSQVTDLEMNFEAIARCMGLSEREAEVAQLLERGLTNREIAGVLSISVMTVQNHLRSIFRKAGVQNRTSLIFELHCHARSRTSPV